MGQGIVTSGTLRYHDANVRRSRVPMVMWHGSDKGQRLEASRHLGAPMPE
jgi:hypothetical protein